MIFTADEQAEHDREEESKKYHAARYAWRNKHKLTPRGVSWSQWFEDKFGEPLDDYAERMQSHE